VSTALSPLEQAERLLAECRTAPMALELMSAAEVARVYARQMKLGSQAENHASGIKLKAEIRLVGLVDRGQRRGEIKLPGDPRAAGVSLEELGVDDARLSEARAIASTFTPDDIDAIVDEANAEDRAFSRRALLIAARNTRSRPAIRTGAVRESDRLRQERHRRIERVRPDRPMSGAEWDSHALGERALIHTARLRRAVRKFPKFIGDLDAAEDLIRHLAWGPSRAT